MPKYRYYFAFKLPFKDKRIILDSTQSHHLARVVRARIGTVVTLFNGFGSEIICELSEITHQNAHLDFKEIKSIEPLPYSITLVQCIAKGKTMESLIHKATELGVKKIIPVYSENCDVSYNNVRQKNKIEKWETTTIEACKQSGNSYIPQISEIIHLNDFLNQDTHNGLCLIASLENNTVSLNTIITKFIAETNDKNQVEVKILIGPEGDFSPAEYNKINELGFIPINLGRNVLKVETATTVAIGLVANKFTEVFKA